MPRNSRRDFLKTTALVGAGAGFWISGARADVVKSPNERIRFACVGLGAKGASDSADCANNGDIVAICEVDDKILDKASNKWPAARKYNDYRKMFEESHGIIDAVTVSTPDHMHAPIAAMAMKLGKPVFCQKPLTRTLYETRRLAEIARETKVATQMGNQGTAHSSLRKMAAMIQAGAVGDVSEIHVWSNRPVWPQGSGRPKPKRVPDNLHWDLWLGVAPKRPYAPGYHPFTWRGYWDFGAGALGDMGCHTLNMPFMALDLRDPISVEGETSGKNDETFPSWSIIKYEFAANDKRPALRLTWYDGTKKPASELFEGKEQNDSGSIIVGSKGKIYAPSDYAENGHILLGGATAPEVKFEESPGHFEEWVRAIRGGQPARSNFPDYAGPLAEMVLLGNLAAWSPGKKIEWDAKNMVAKNAPECEPLIKPVYQNGYTPI